MTDAERRGWRAGVEAAAQEVERGIDQINHDSAMEQDAEVVNHFRGRQMVLRGVVQRIRCLSAAKASAATPTEGPSAPEEGP